MIFRTSVSGYETYIPKDYTHPNKTRRQFRDDVKQLLAEMHAEDIAVYTLENGEDHRGFISGDDVQDYLDTGLKKLGYAESDICEIGLGGECLYHSMKSFTSIYPRETARQILVRNRRVSKEIDRRLEVVDLGV